MVDASLAIAVVAAVGSVAGLLIKFAKDRSLANGLKKQGESLSELREDVDVQLKRRPKSSITSDQFAQVTRRLTALEERLQGMQQYHSTLADLRARVEQLQQAQHSAEGQWGDLMREIGELAGQVKILVSDRG